MTTAAIQFPCYNLAITYKIRGYILATNAKLSLETYIKVLVTNRNL